MLQKQKKWKGGKVEHKCADAAFENQESGVNECVPVAVSNCLKQLKKTFKLDIDDKLIAIGELKQALKTTPFGTGLPWPFFKQFYLQKINAGIQTIIFLGGPQAMPLVEEACERNYVVEICTPEHCVSMSAITKITAKNKQTYYTMDLTHDIQQGKNGGLKTETIVYDHNNNLILNGPPWAKGKRIVYFVIQGPFENYYPEKADTITGFKVTGELNSFKFLDKDYWVQSAGLSEDKKLIESKIEVETTVKRDKYTGADILLSMNSGIVTSFLSVRAYDYAKKDWVVLLNNYVVPNIGDQPIRLSITKDKIKDFISEEKKMKLELTNFTPRNPYIKRMLHGVNIVQWTLYP